MIPVEKKSMIEIDRKNMLNRYSKIAWNSSSERPMNSNPPRNKPKRPTQKTTLQNRIIDSRSREPDKQRGDRVPGQAPAQPAQGAGRLNRR